ncbi:hypothetical protein SAMN02910339_02496 [Lachnospiraceae bacterium YSD2013]|nr:hypothetical protein SAMN02910339_02496 [Lachnospiraceae bacterium YSD2013]
MRIHELMKLIDKYYAGIDKKLTVCNDKPGVDGEGRRVGLYADNDGFRVDEYTEPGSSWYSFHTCHFCREGGAVYYFLNRSVYKEELHKHSFPEYEVLCRTNDHGLKIPYGVVMSLEGVWNVYIGDETLLYIKDTSVKTLRDAVDYFDSVVDGNEAIKLIVKRFVRDNGQI